MPKFNGCLASAWTDDYMFYGYIPTSTPLHYRDVIMSAMASQITSLAIVYSTVYSEAYQRKHQSSASLGFVRGIHWWPVNSPHKRPVTRNMFPFNDVIMNCIFYSHTAISTPLSQVNYVNKEGPVVSTSINTATVLSQSMAIE